MTIKDLAPPKKDNGAYSIKELMKLWGTTETVTKLKVYELLESGVLLEVRKDGGRGRTVKAYKLKSDPAKR